MKVYRKIVSSNIYMEFKDGSRSRLRKQVIYINQDDHNKGTLKDGREVRKKDDLWIYYSW